MSCPLGSIWHVRQVVGEWPVFAHSSHSPGLLLASDDAESAAYPTVDKGSANLGTSQRVPHTHGEATTAARHAATDRSSIEPDREGMWTKHAPGPTASLPMRKGAHQGGLQRPLTASDRSPGPGPPTTAFAASSAA
jgi:hypothetical protein